MHSLDSCLPFFKYSLALNLNCTHFDVRAHCFSWGSGPIKPRHIQLLLSAYLEYNQGGSGLKLGTQLN